MLFLGSGDQLPDSDQSKNSLDMNEENDTVQNEATSKAEILQKGEKNIQICFKTA